VVEIGEVDGQKEMDDGKLGREGLPSRTTFWG